MTATARTSRIGSLAAGLRRLLRAAGGREAVRHRLLLAHAPDPLVQVDAAGTLLFASAGCGGLLGLAPAAMRGTRFQDGLHPDERDEVVALMAAVARGERPHGTILHRQRRGDGSWIRVESAWRAAPRADGMPASLVGSIRDARAVREADAAVRAAQLPYKALADTLPQLVWMERADTGETIYANQAFERYFGATGRTGADRAGRIHRDDAAAIEAAYAAARAGGRPCELQGRLLRGDGGASWHQLVVSPLRKDGALVGWLVSALDIDDIVAARRTLEETRDLLRLSQEAAGAGLFDVDRLTGVAILSPESARLHRLPADRPAAIGFRDWLRRVAPEDRGPTLRAVRDAVADGRTFDVSFRSSGPGADVRWIQAIGRPCRDAAGAATRIVGLTLDVSARKESEAALLEAKGAAERAKAAAERANAAKTDFLSAMSHEIRTPLNAVIGFTGLLAGSERLDPDLRRYADLARASGDALLTVVDDILDFSSVEAGAVSLRREPFAIEALIDGCLTIVGSAATAKGIDTGSVIDATLPRRLIGDEARLRQILLNLLNNAVKFTRAGSVTLSLRHEGRTPWGERIRFSVVDSGIGIAADKQHRLFERFSQVDGSIRRDHGGTGLGLAISRRLVDLMGGEIGVISEAGHGATFWFTLTLPRAGAEGEAPRPSGADAPGRTGRILLVEDIPVNQELACLMLRARGHAVDVAEDGFAAVRAVADGGYGLVLMDVQMPGLDGIMATRLIRCLPGEAARVPVVAMTANVLPDEVRAFREAGMDDHLGKPFDAAGLDAVVARWLPDRPVPAAAPADRPADGAADAAEPAIDRGRYEDSLALLPPAAVARLLGHLAERVTGGFSGEAQAPADRDRLRAEAHALASVSGMLGFVPLCAACGALDGYGEARIARDGREGFDLALARARALAAAAAFETRRMIADMADERPVAEAAGR